MMMMAFVVGVLLGECSFCAAVEAHGQEQKRIKVDPMMIFVVQQHSHVIVHMLICQ